MSLTGIFSPFPLNFLKKKNYKEDLGTTFGYSLKVSLSRPWLCVYC